MRIFALFMAAVISACATSAISGTEPIEVTGRVVKKTHLARDKEHTAYVIELDRPVNFQGHSYTEAMINFYNDHIMFEAARVLSQRIRTHCSFILGTQWGDDSLLCTSDELLLEP